MKRTLITKSLIILTSTISLHAQVISVDWGGDYVTGNQQFGEGGFGSYRFNDSSDGIDGNATVDPTVAAGNTRQRILFGLTDGTSGYHKPGNNYTVPVGKTGNFYMGTAIEFAGGSADPAVFRVSDNAGGNTTDTIRLRPQNGNVSTFALLGFAKSDFLNSTNSSPRGLNSSTSITVIIGGDYANTDTPVYRYAVLNGGQWYLSSTSFSTTFGTATFTLEETGTESWGAFNPLASDGASLLPGTGIKVEPASYEEQIFNDVQGFGLWASNGFDLDLEGFSATTVAAAATGTPYQTWLASFSLPTDGTGDGADVADPDKDGIPNLIEYALGGNPKVGNTSILPSATGSGTPPNLSYSTNAGNTDITYIVQSSTNLVAWTDIARSVGGAITTAINGSGATITDSGGAIRNITVNEATNLSTTGKRFLRLKVTRP